MKRKTIPNLIVVEGLDVPTRRGLSVRTLWYVLHSLKHDEDAPLITAFDLIGKNPALMFLNIIEK